MARFLRKTHLHVVIHDNYKFGKFYSKNKLRIDVICFSVHLRKLLDVEINSLENSNTLIQ